MLRRVLGLETNMTRADEAEALLSRAISHVYGNGRRMQKQFASENGEELYEECARLVVDIQSFLSRSGEGATNAAGHDAAASMRERAARVCDEVVSAAPQSDCSIDFAMGTENGAMKCANRIRALPLEDARDGQGEGA